jgi:hypothetical protein
MTSLGISIASLAVNISFTIVEMAIELKDIRMSEVTLDFNLPLDYDQS